MVQTITPVVHGGRRTRWGATLALHVLGAALAAGAMGAVLGAAGAALGAPWGRAGMLAVAAVAALYALREIARLPVPLPELRRQVPEWWRASFPPGVAAFLYGAGLGVGFLTHLRHGTLVAVSAAAVAAGDPWIGALVVAPFGLGRSLVVAAVWRATTEDRLGDVVAAVERLGERALRRAVNASALVVVAVVAVLVPPAAGPGFPSAATTGALALTFGWAALAKAARPGAWEAALDGFGLPLGVRAAARIGTPVAEAVVAGLLLAGEIRGGAVAAAVLLTAFSAAILRARRVRGDALPCGCFGGARVRSARTLLVRNAALGALAVAGAISGEPLPTFRTPDGSETLPAALVIGGGILAAVLLARAGALWSRRPQTG